MIRPTRLAPLAVAGALLAVTGTASAAPTVTLDQSCYAHLPGRGSEPIVATISGGTPGGEFTLTARGRNGGTAGSTSGTFDAAGNALAGIENVSPPSGTNNPTKGEPLELSIQDVGAGTPDTPVASALITNISMAISPKPRNPKLRRSVRVSAGRAFAGRTLYGFVTKPGSGRVLRRVRLGKANVCGYVKAREVVAPRGSGGGSYVLYVNAGPKLDKDRAVSFSFRIIKF